MQAPAGNAARPTSERVREALFAWLGDVEGARVLDGFAGSGAVGIEALSRGAAGAVFVERAAASLAALEANLRALGLGPQARVVRGDAGPSIRRLGREAAIFDLVFLDPPYAAGEAERALRAVVEAGVLAPGGTLVLEAARRHPVPAVAGLLVAEERRYGDTVLIRLAADPGGSDAAAGPERAGPGPAGGPIVA